MTENQLLAILYQLTHISYREWVLISQEVDKAFQESSQRVFVEDTVALEQELRAQLEEFIIPNK